MPKLKSCCARGTATSMAMVMEKRVNRCVDAHVSSALSQVGQG